jgi:hypothetical protein
LAVVEPKSQPMKTGSAIRAVPFAPVPLPGPA